MSTSQAVAKLTARLDKLFRESAEARNELREWLFEIEKEQAHSSAPPPTSTPKSPPGVYFNGIKAKYSSNPINYGWILVENIQAKKPHMVYQRSFPSADVTLRYYYKSGAVQLIYDLECHPQWVRRMQVYYDSEGEEITKEVEETRLVHETFRILENWKFKQLLEDIPNWFGKGTITDVIGS